MNKLWRYIQIYLKSVSSDPKE